MVRRAMTPTEDAIWAASAKLPNRWVTAGVVLATTITANWFSLRAFLATSYTAGGIERTYHALLVSIVAGLVGGTLVLLMRRKRSRRAGFALTGFLAVGIAAGFFFGRWFAAGVTVCVDGTGIRTGCGTPWFGTFMKPKYAGGAYAGLGATLALVVGMVALGLSAAFKRRRATNQARS